MPIYEYEPLRPKAGCDKCATCGGTFEAIVRIGASPPPCPSCRSRKNTKLMGAPAIQIKEARATGRIEKRVKNYLKDGKFSEATRFADKASSMVKSDKVKRIADKLHEKTGK